MVDDIPADLRRRCLLKTVAQTVVIWTLALAVLPMGIVHIEAQLGLDHLHFRSPAVRATGVAVFCLASTLGLWSGWTMAWFGAGTPLPLDPAVRLVLVGPYRHVRNPMAIAGLAQGAGVGLMLGSPGVLAYVAAGLLFWNFVVRRWEERDLERRFGEPYVRYRAAVRCWIPRHTPYQAMPADAHADHRYP